MKNSQRSFRTARPLESSYLEWAKAHGKVTWNLATSGVPPCDVRLLSPSVDDFTMAADNEYGWPPLVERIARRYDVDPSCVVLAHGTSMANHVACAALLGLLFCCGSFVACRSGGAADRKLQRSSNAIRS